MDAIELLTGQHRSLEALMKAWMEAEAWQREALFKRVGDELTVHLSSEEQIFYPAVKAHRTEDILLESLEEHLSLKRVMADLLALSPDDPSFEAKFHVLKEQAEHHHKEEEEHLFPKVKQLLEPMARSTLGEQMHGLQQQLKREGDPREAIAEQTDKAAPLE
ncbi:hemerythrin domain-containing protein [Azohydromonas caseinilytica]|uniref:Hemerythrin domain-containing protein n=1 Tax=Azohydromonas caseinilytica TaxID=2728836 RepID=A0A848F2D3_9BURK|nr:hemerythrin domain-containing protein [Azohydromonas caseinilytica]NML13562.1 hemerythrin domain-containing protein [Azohydromonas caseinilytica]